MSSLSKSSIIINEIIGFIESQYSIGSTEVTPNTDLIVEGVIDSMQVIELIVYLETTYHVEFTEDDLLDSSLSSVAGMAELITSKQ